VRTGSPIVSQPGHEYLTLLMHMPLKSLWPDVATGEIGGAVDVLPPTALTTPWASLTASQVPAGRDLHKPGITAGEVAHVVLSGQLEGRGAGDDLDLVAPAILVCDASSSPSLGAGGEAPAQVLTAAVEYREGQSRGAPGIRTQAQRADEAALVWREAIHGGTGRLATRHMWGPDDFASTWTFIDHAVLGPEASVGYHYHDALEEAFIVLAGRGLMTVADHTFAVEAGSVTYQAIGQGHGIYNPGPDNLAFLRLAVALPDEAFTTIDLDDDLRGREPIAGTAPDGSGRP